MLAKSVWRVFMRWYLVDFLPKADLTQFEFLVLPQKSNSVLLVRSLKTAISCPNYRLLLMSPLFSIKHTQECLG